MREQLRADTLNRIRRDREQRCCQLSGRMLTLKYRIVNARSAASNRMKSKTWSINSHPLRGNEASPFTAVRITSHGRSGRSGRSGTPLCGGLFPQRPLTPLLQPGAAASDSQRSAKVGDANVRARRPFRRSSSEFWPFLSTIHYSLSTAAPQSGPAVPCKRLRNVLYCKVEPEHNQVGPERAACTLMPALHARPADHVDLLCTERPNPARSELRSGPCRCQQEMPNPAVRCAAHPQRDETRHATHARAAGTRLCILSQKACSSHCLAHFLHSNAISFAFSDQ